MSDVVKFKQGDVHPETGKVFWEYAKNHANGERWISREAFVAYKAKRAAYLVLYYRKRAEALKAANSARYYAHRSAILAKEKVNRIANKEQLAIRRRARSKLNRAKLTAQHRAYRWRHRAEFNARQVQRRAVNPLLALAQRLRKRTCLAFRRRGFAKGASTQRMLGCDWETLKLHIEAKFSAGMTWENRSLWHIDHIIPLSSAEGAEALYLLCHYTNLQPLWAADNIRKSDKYQPLAA